MATRQDMRLTPEINNLLYNNEEIEIVIDGGYGGVSEYLIVTAGRLIVARELQKRVFAVVFNREKEIWTELRPNDEGTDLLIFSPETMERVRNLKPETITHVKEKFGIDEGEHENFIPREDKMYHTFIGLKGSTKPETITTRSHIFFYIIYILLFAILSFEAGFNTSSMNHNNPVTGFTLLFAASLSCAVLVKRTFIMTISSALGFLFYGYGLYKAAGGTNPPGGPSAGLLLLFLVSWIIAALMEFKHMYCGSRPLLVPPIKMLIGATIFLTCVVLITLKLNEQLAPNQYLRFKRNLKKPATACFIRAEGEKNSAMSIFSPTDFVIVSLLGGAEGPYESWSNSWDGQSIIPPATTYGNGILIKKSGPVATALQLPEHKEIWNHIFPDKFTFTLEEHPVPDNTVLLGWIDPLNKDSKPDIRFLPTGEILSLNRNTGDILWKKRFELAYPGLPWSSPSFVKGNNKLIIIFTPGWNLRVIDRETGDDKWKEQLPPGSAETVSSGDTIAYSFHHNSISGLNIYDGEKLWTWKTSGSLISPLITHNSGDFLVIKKEKGIPILTFIDSRNGEEKYQRPLPSAIVNNFSMAGASEDLIYWHNGVYRFFRKYPAKDILLSTTSHICSVPIHNSGKIYLGTDDGFISSVDSTDGKQIWKYRMCGPVAEGGILAIDRGVIAYSTSGIIYAFHK
jgi:outer membrane protein assembly factor BamB